MRSTPRWLTAAAMLLALLAAAGPAHALGTSTFESKDGNLVLDNLAAKDWQNAPNLRRGNDKASGQGDDSFGQGTKEDSPVPTVVDGSIPNNKSDLLRFYVANETAGSTPFLYLAWVRANTLGTANMDFEFNKSRTPSGNGVTPVRSAGDVLIQFDFASGGNVVNLAIHRWVTTGTPSTVCEASNTLPCWGKGRILNTSGAADGAVNDGFGVFDPIANVQIVSQGFGEAAIDLAQALQLGPGQCESFGSAHLNSRSSDSFTSAVKDFIAPIPVDINLCQPLTVKVKKVNPAGNPLGGGVFELYRDDGDGVLDSGDTRLGTCTTAAATGECSFSPVNGSGTVTFIVHEETPPNGYTAAPDQVFSYAFSPTPTTITRTFTDQPVPGKIVIKKTNDLGTVLAGAKFEVRRDAAPVGGSPGPEDTSVAGSCTTDSTGICTVSGLALGEYWVVETVVPPGHSGAAPKHATIGLGSAPNQGATVNLTFVNPRTHRVIVITCHEGTNTLVSSTVTVDGVQKSTLSAAPSGFTEAQLCGLGGATYGGRPHGTLSATVNIPSH